MEGVTVGESSLDQWEREKEETEMLAEVARTSLYPPGWGENKRVFFYQAQEYTDFREFLEEELGFDGFNELMKRFFAYQAKNVIEGMENAGFPIQFVSEEAKQKVEKLIQENTKPK